MNFPPLIYLLRDHIFCKSRKLLSQKIYVPITYVPDGRTDNYAT